MMSLNDELAINYLGVMMTIAVKSVAAMTVK